MFKNIFLRLSLIAVIFFGFIAKALSQKSLVKPVYFKPGSFIIEKRYKKVLDVVAKQLSSDTFGYLKIFGFSDTNGSEEFNEILSEKRANAVYKYLLAHAKFDTSNVYVTWIGESTEAYDLHLPGAHIQQRCVDVFIQFTKKKEKTVIK